MNSFLRRLPVLAVIAAAALITTACGDSVQGNTYETNGSVVKIEFQSGGKAFLSTGPLTTNCTYTTEGKAVTLVCEGEKTVFTVNDNDSLSGPPGGFLMRLTKKKA
jgi:hypothetical protein